MKRLAILISTCLLVPLIVLLAINRSGPPARELSEAQLVAIVQSNLVSKMAIRLPSSRTNTATVQGTFYLTAPAGQLALDHGTPKVLPFRATVHLTPDLEANLLKATNVTIITPNPAAERLSTFLHPSK